MNIEDSKDPWNQGQKQVSVKIPGWVAFLVKAPFRLVFGLLGAFGAAQQASGDSSDYTPHEPSDFAKGVKNGSYNWDGSLNTDGDPHSNK